MVLFGLGIGVLICFLGGLMAVDIAPRNASGAALGVVGIASYIGAGLQDVMSGILIEGNKTVQNGVDVYDFTYINWFWIGAALLSLSNYSEIIYESLLFILYEERKGLKDFGRDAFKRFISLQYQKDDELDNGSKLLR